MGGCALFVVPPLHGSLFLEPLLPFFRSWPFRGLSLVIFRGHRLSGKDIIS